MIRGLAGFGFSAMRAGLILFFLLTDLYGFAWLQINDLASPHLPSLLLVMLPTMLAGNHLGAQLFNQVDMRVMRQYTLVLLSGLAATGLFSALL